MQFLKNHFRQFPEEAAPVMLAVQAGAFSINNHVKGASDFFPDYKKLDKVPDEFKMEVLMMWPPALNKNIISKVAKAEYNGKRDERILAKIWLFMTGSSEQDPLPTRSKTLLKDILTYKRKMYDNEPKLQLTHSHLVKFEAHGVFKPVDECQEDEGIIVYRSILHTLIGLKAAILKTLVCVKGQAVIQKSWDEKQATLTNKDADFQKSAHALFNPDATKKYQMTNIAKADDFKERLKKAAENLEEIEEAKAATTCASTRSPEMPEQTPAKRRKAMRTLSDESLPEELKADEAEE